MLCTTSPVDLRISNLTPKTLRRGRFMADFVGYDDGSGGEDDYEEMLQSYVTRRHVLAGHGSPSRSRSPSPEQQLSHREAQQQWAVHERARRGLGGDQAPPNPKRDWISSHAQVQQHAKKKRKGQGRPAPAAKRPQSPAAEKPTEPTLAPTLTTAASSPAEAAAAHSETLPATGDAAGAPARPPTPLPPENCCC